MVVAIRHHIRSNRKHTKAGENQSRTFAITLVPTGEEICWSSCGQIEEVKNQTMERTWSKRVSQSSQRRITSESFAGMAQRTWIKAHNRDAIHRSLTWVT